MADHVNYLVVQCIPHDRVQCEECFPPPTITWVCLECDRLKAELAAAQERVRELASIATERRVHIIAVEAMLEAAEAELAKLREQFYVDDGFGSTWGPCPECGNRMSVMRPGKANCGHCEMVRVSGQLIEQRNALQAENAKLREQVNGLQHTCRQQQELIERAVKGGRK